MDSGTVVCLSTCDDDDETYPMKIPQICQSLVRFGWISRFDSRGTRLDSGIVAFYFRTTTHTRIP